MKYSDFEAAISAERMARYLMACNGDSRKAMTLYRYKKLIPYGLFGPYQPYSQLMMKKNLRLILSVILFAAMIRFLTDFCNIQWILSLIISTAAFIFISLIIKYFLKKTGKIS